MKTDLPLKRLTALRPHDLLPLVGRADQEVLDVLTLELPATATSLDTLLRLRTHEGQEYLHLLEWQGYNDGAILWRSLGYLSWLGQHRSERPVLATIIYLKPGDDVGDTLRQEIAGHVGWSVTLPCVRLWEHDAEAALALGRPGLAALSPLMANATPQSVERAVALIAEQAPEAQQNELLSVLGIFAEQLIAPQQFIRLVSKERLMANNLISYLFQEEFAVFEQRLAALEQAKQEDSATFEQRLAALEQAKQAELAQQLAALEQAKQAELAQQQAALEQVKQAELAQQQVELAQQLAQTLIDVLAVRFAAAPLQLAQQIRQFREPAALQRLIVAAAQAKDIVEVERLIAAART